MNNFNLDYQGVTFDDMKRHILKKISRMSEEDAYDLQEVVQEVLGCDVFWSEQFQCFYRDTEAGRVR